jgi:hypothetical protein
MLGQRARYLWADGDLDLAWTVAAIEGTTAQAAVAAYGGEQQTEFVGRMEFAQAFVPEGDLGEYFLIQVKSHGRHVVVIENNGWLGTRTEIAQRVSKGGKRFFSVYWSPSGDRLVEAADGRLVTSLEPLSIGDAAGEGHNRPDWLRDIAFTTDGLHSTMLAVLEQRTGLAVHRQWLDEQLPTYRIPGH